MKNYTAFKDLVLKLFALSIMLSPLIGLGLFGCLGVFLFPPLWFLFGMAVIANTFN